MNTEQDAPAQNMRPEGQPPLPQELPRETEVHPYLNLPIQENKIFFASRLGAYNGNPKYITEEILRQKLPYDLVWMVDKHIFKYIDEFPKRVRLVMQDTDDALREAATAKIWIDDTWRRHLLNRGITKRQSQVYIQTWRGSFGLRKVGAERHNAVMKDVKRAKRDTDQIDYLISNSAWESRLYQRIFWGKGKVMELGHARNDILFSADREEIRRKIFERLKLPMDAKLLYYAPTLDKSRNIKKTIANATITRLALSKRFGGEWVILARMGKVTNKAWPGALRGVVRMPMFLDTHEILVAADAMLTDYSSAVLDFALTGRPAFLYAPDEKQYTKNRGLYYPLSETPFQVARTNDELAFHIEKFEEESYTKQLQSFFADKGCVDDGCASQRVVELLKELIPANNEINA